jgi:hypothetical protein
VLCGDCIEALASLRSKLPLKLCLLPSASLKFISRAAATAFNLLKNDGKPCFKLLYVSAYSEKLRLVAF